ncbi:MAG: sodium:solute symporter family protein, partial [Gemmatimonadota bacterium]
MRLDAFDWTVVAAYGALALIVGLYFARRAGKGTTEFFLSGRKLPWWMLGTSMVATTFSTDTPNLVTDLVRTGGVSQNWLWWAFLITGMCTVFFYAKLWRRSGVFTDMGFYELRYSGKPAAFLRGFRALYLGVFFNVMIMATVTLAAIKIGGVLLGIDKYTTVLIAGTITVIYSATSGLWGVVVTDLLLFVIAMVGALAAAYYALAQPEVGGLAGLVSHPEIAGKLALLPDFTDWKVAVPVFVVPIAVQWWATWYPGSEPGGGGYVAQRMLASRNETDSMKATLWFNIAHYALRPWPWILVALASLAVYPTLDSLAAAFPNVDPSILKHDLAYPAMLVFLPHGLLGLVVASLAAAYMSTISTHLNWGASYVVDDFYRRFLVPDRDERHYVAVARLSTVGLIVLALLVSLWLQNALQAFQILLQIGAGTGMIFLLRWFWWRINAWSEISAMVISFAVALWFQFGHEAVGLPAFHPSLQLVIGVALTTAVWLGVTFATAPTDTATLQDFYDRIRPFGRGWARVVQVDDTPARGSVTAALTCWLLGCV